MNNIPWESNYGHYIIEPFEDLTPSNRTYDNTVYACGGRGNSKLVAYSPTTKLYSRMDKVECLFCGNQYPLHRELVSCEGCGAALDYNNILKS